jgi:hypothetical protein
LRNSAVLCGEVVEGRFMRMSLIPFSRVWQCGAVLAGFKENNAGSTAGEW